VEAAENRAVAATSSDDASSTTQPRPASDAEPPLHLLVLLPILHRTPDKQRAGENEWHEQEHEHDNYECGVDYAILPSAGAFTLGRRKRSAARRLEH
jgi:hypothetical protein